MVCVGSIPPIPLSLMFLPPQDFLFQAFTHGKDSHIHSQPPDKCFPIDTPVIAMTIVGYPLAFATRLGLAVSHHARIPAPCEMNTLPAAQLTFSVVLQAYTAPAIVFSHSFASFVDKYVDNSVYSVDKAVYKSLSCE